METENAFKEISEMLSEIKSSDGNNNLLELLSKLLDTKIELDNDQLYTDQFEDISIKIKKNGYYVKDSLKRETLLKELTLQGKKDDSKPVLLLLLLDKLNMTPANLMAIGDQGNDLSMLKLAQVGVAMGNAIPELKAVASFVTADCDHDGVAVALEKFVAAKN